MTVIDNSRNGLRRRRFSLVSLFEAMATPHALDRYLELVDPMTTVWDLRGRVEAVRRSTSDTVTLTIRPTRQWQGFEAGQYVQVGVVIDGVRHTRCYSPAGSACGRDGSIELTVKAHPEGLVSGYLHAKAEPGLMVNLSQAQGEFVLPRPRPPRIVLVSGGSGITPMMAMLRTLVDEGHGGDITFLHYAYTENDVAYRTELDAIAAANPRVNIVYAYTDETAAERAEDGHLGGFFGRDHLDAAAPWFADGQTFLCGPPGLMRGVRETYRELGIGDRLHTEEFAPAEVVVDGEAGGTLSFASSGVTAENGGQTLLEQAEAAGLSPEYGCRMGICFSCTSTKTSGCTKNVRTGETDTEPDKQIQLCVSVPVGDVTVDI